MFGSSRTDVSRFAPYAMATTAAKTASRLSAPVAIMAVTVATMSITLGGVMAYGS
jgi:hypothetical protein